jgi:hypothetical protein
VTGIINQDKYPSSATVLDVFNIADSDEDARQRGFSVSFFTAKRKDAARERARGVIETMRRSWTQLCRAPAVGGERRPEASITPRPSSAPGTVIACARLTGTFGKTAVAVPRARI